MEMLPWDLRSVQGGLFPAVQNVLENEMFLLSVNPPHQIKAPALLLLRSVQQLLINLEQAPISSYFSNWR